jgi:hypothetical protein
LLSSTRNSNNDHSMPLNPALHDSASDEASNNKDSVAVPHGIVHQPSPSSQPEPSQQATTRRRPGSTTYGVAANIPASTPYTLTQPATGPPGQPMQQSSLSMESPQSGQVQVMQQVSIPQYACRNLSHMYSCQYSNLNWMMSHCTIACTRCGLELCHRCQRHLLLQHSLESKHGLRPSQPGYQA